MRNIIILFLAFILVGCNQSVSPTDGQFYEYKNEDKGYSFSLDRPEGWDEVQRGRALAGFVPEMDQTMAVEMFGIYVEDLRDDPLSFEEYTDVYKGLLADGGIMDETVEETDISVAGTSARKIVYVDSVTDGEGNETQRIKTQEIWGMIDEVVFSLVYHAEENKFDEYLIPVEKAIETFEFEVK